MSVDKNSVLFIRTKQKEDYFFDGIKSYGYDIVTPYIGNSFFPRCMREVWFRGHLPFEKLWYNKKIKSKKDKDTIIIFDPLIKPEFLRWIVKCHSDKRLIFMYANRTDCSICPNLIPPEFEICSYDKDDCDEWNLRHFGTGYFDVYQVEPDMNPEYDIVYVGRDKGRADYLLNLKKQFEDLGLSMYLHICADRKYFSKKKSFYRPMLRYQDYLKYAQKSRAILNIVPEGQKSITMRELEVIYGSIKGITNNKGVKDWEFYDPSRFFILGEDSLDKLSEFLDTPFKKVDRNRLKEIAFEASVDNLLKEKK